MAKCPLNKGIRLIYGSWAGWLAATCHAPRPVRGGALSQARRLVVDVRCRLGLVGFDLVGIGLLVLLGLLDLRLLELLAFLHLGFLGCLRHSGGPAAQCQGERQCTKSHVRIIAYWRRTKSTSLGNSPQSSRCRDRKRQHLNSSH